MSRDGVYMLAYIPPARNPTSAAFIAERAEEENQVWFRNPKPGFRDNRELFFKNATIRRNDWYKLLDAAVSTLGVTV